MRRLLLLPLFVLASCSSPSETPQANPCEGVSGPCTALCNASEKDVQTALIKAQPGSTIAFCSGTFTFTNTLTVGASKVTLKGRGIDETVLAFDGQKAGSEGIFAKDVSGLVFEGLTVRNTGGDGIKVEGADGVTFRKVKVVWTRGPNKENGAYGIYPVQCKNVLVEDSVASGASDAGIYVGQSEDIVVRRNVAEKNVAGIEIENSYRADVFENEARENTAGILVFDLPGLPKKGGHGVRVFKNKVRKNNTVNFAPAGNIVGKVPRGTGMLIMANKDVDVFDNELDSNGTFQVGIVSYHVAQDEGFEAKDPAYYAYPVQVFVHDNKMTNGGTDPDAVNPIGNLLKVSMSTFPQKRVPDVIYDGIVDGKRTSQKGTPNPMDICVKIDAANTFADLRAETAGPGKGFPDMKTDLAPFTCTLPPLAAVKVPQ